MSAPMSLETLIRAVAHATEHPDADDALGREALVAAAHRRIGETIAGMRLVEVLGVGGMGVVFGAHDAALERDVALKVVRPGLVGDADLLAEARRAARLEHPGIARIHAAGSEDGVAWIAMERIHGTTLRAAMLSADWSPRRIVGVVRALSDALADAHAAGLVHRDVKPENVMLTHDGRVVLLDFGLAAPVGERTGAGRGTPGYHPRDSERTHPGLDVYALAVMLVEGLVGRRPLPGEAVAALSGRAVGLSKGTAQALLEAAEAILRSPEAASAVALGATLDAIAARPARRRRAVALGVGLLVTAGLGAMALTPGAQPHTAAPPALAPMPERVTARVDELPMALASLSPDGAVVAWVDSDGLTLFDLHTRTHLRHALPAGLSLRYGQLAWTERGDAVRLFFYGGPESGSKVVTARRDGGFEVVVPTGSGNRHRALGLQRLVWDNPSRRFGLESLAGDFTPIDTPSEVTPRLMVPGPDGLAAAVAVSPPGRLQEVELWVVDLRSGARRVVMPATTRLFMANDQLAVAWRDPATLIVGLYEPEADGGNLFALDLGADAPEPRRLSDWRGLHLGHLSLAADGKKAAFVVTRQQTDTWVGTLTPSEAAPPAGVIAARKPLPEAERPAGWLEAEAASGGVPVGLALEDARRLTLGDAEERPSAWTRSGEALWVTVVDRGQPAAWRWPLEGAPARVATMSTWPIDGPEGAALGWRWGAGVWTLGRLDGEEGQPLVEVAGELGAGRPGPGTAHVRCAGEAPCVLARREGEGLVFEALVTDAEGQREVVAAFASPMWGAVTRWDIGPSGRLAILGGNRLLIGHGGAAGRRWESFQLSGADACWPQHIAASTDGPFVLGTTCLSRPIYRLFAFDPRGEGRLSTLRTSEQRWLAHPQLSPDGARLAWSERAYQTDLWLAELPP